MGIHGLSTFIQRYHDKYKEKIYLRDCPVVIDGCNLMFYLYFDWRQASPTASSSNASPTKKRSSSSGASGGSPLSKPSPLKLPHLFGGDYASYAQNVRTFFQHLKLCGITPIVLFDGAYDALKIKTAFKRFAENLKQNVRQSGNNLKGVTPGCSYSPVFMKALFVEILQEQKILHFQTEQEADCTIAFIARNLGNCPILSSDSDFHIYIDAKVLALHTLRFKKVLPPKDKTKLQSSSLSPLLSEKEKVWTLHSQYVCLSNLCHKEFNLNDARLLPLAAVILGNDWITTATFSHFHSTTAGGSKVKRNSRIAYLLRWLGKQKSYNRVFYSMLATVQEPKREQVAKLVNEIVSIYKGTGGEIRVWKMLLQTGQVDKFLIQDNNEFTQSSDLTIGDMLEKLSLDESLVEDEQELNDVKDDEDKEAVEEDCESDDSDTEEIEIESCENQTKLPEWYIDAHIRCVFPTFLLKIVKNQTVFLSPQAECSTMLSTHTMAIPIIQVLSGILLGPNKNITLVSRNKSRITDIKVDSVTELKEFGTLPLLSENCKEFKTAFPQESRAQIIFEALGLYSTDFVQFIQQWPVSLRMWVISLVYFLKCVNQDSTKLSQEDSINNKDMEAANSSALPVAVAILCCVIKTSVLNPSGSSRKSDLNNGPTISDLLNQTEPTTISQLRMFYARYESVAPLSSSKAFMKSYDFTQTYNNCRFTCILFHLHQLNRVLGDPFKTPRLSLQTNNWFSYHLAGSLAAGMKSQVQENDCNKIGNIVRDLSGMDDMGLVVDQVLNFV